METCARNSNTTAEPCVMKSDVAKTIYAFDDLNYVITLIHKVQKENARLINENKELREKVSRQDVVLKRLVSKDIWR